MSEPKWMKHLERGVGAAAACSHRHPLVALALAGLLTACGMWLSARLSLNADLTELLPRTFQSVRDLDMLRERFGGMGYVVIVGMEAEPEALRRFADDTAAKLETLEGIRFVDYRRETDFFRERALYYLQLDDLQEVARRIREREKWERRQRNPMFIKLDDEPAPALDVSDLEAKYTGSSMQRLSGGGERYYLDPEQRLVVLLAKPDGTSADLDYAKQIVGRVERFLGGQDLSAYPGLKIALTGTYKKKLDQQGQIASDVAWASSVALVLMLLYLAFHFRSLLGMGLIIVPVSVGLTWTYGFVGLAYGSVNLLTAFLGAILGGLGTEHGIHLLGRYSGLRSGGMGSEEAIREAFMRSGSSAFISSLVAALTFCSLAISEFRAFREFGVIAAAGMLIVVVAYIAVFPSIIGLAARFGWRIAARDAVAGKRSSIAALLPRHTGLVAATVGGLLVLLALRVPWSRFNYDLGALEDSDLPSFQLDRKVNKLLGYSQTPVVIFTDSSEDERALVAQITDRKKALGEASTVDFAAALDDLVPPQQSEKQKVLARIKKTLDRVDREGLDEQTRRRFDDLVKMVRAEPFTRDDIPKTIRRQFEGLAGQGGFVLIFPGISLSDGAKVQALAEEVRGLKLPGDRTVSAIGEAMILADIIDMVTRESGPVLVAAVILVLLAMWATLGSLKLSLTCLSPTVISILGLVGFMTVSDLEFNFLNIVAIPVLIGTTVDAGVHLICRLNDGRQFESVLAETGRAICGGLLTSAVGFGALLLADHPGLRSLGTLTILGFSLNLVVMLLGFPAFLLLIMRRARSKVDAPQTTTP
ncbi:MAG: efflux RND transporter permease subunit [Myxococcales bacterium]